MVDPAYWRDPEAEDIAILRIDPPLPAGTTVLPLGTSSAVEGHEIQTYGFPLETKPKQGMYGYGRLGNTMRAESGEPLLQLAGATEIGPGFSGAPVMDKLTGRIVGMVTAITAPDTYGRQAETAFVTPAETLRQICPQLLLWDILAEYRERVLQATRFVNLAGIPLPRDRSGRRIELQVPLEKVYIRIQALPEDQSRARQEAEHRQIEAQVRDEGPSAFQPRDALAIIRMLGEYFYRQGQVYQASTRPEPINP